MEPVPVTPSLRAKRTIATAAAFFIIWLLAQADGSYDEGVPALAGVVAALVTFVVYTRRINRSEAETPDRDQDASAT